MVSYKIVASDLDGTLLNSKVAVSAENRQAMRDMAANGVHFVPTSGRTLTEIPLSIREDPAVRFSIYSDGAGIYDREVKAHICTAYMSREDSLFLLDVLGQYRTILTVRHKGVSYVDVTRNNDAQYKEHRLSNKYRDFIYETNQPVGDYDSFCRSLGELEMICAFFADDSEQQACKRRLEATGKYQTGSSERTNLEIFSSEAGKGRALLRLAAHLGVDPAATIGVGDSTNDSDLLARAGLGLAVSNAYDELKAIADAVICSNDEHAMQYILEHYIKA